MPTAGNAEFNCMVVGVSIMEQLMQSILNTASCFFGETFEGDSISLQQWPALQQLREQPSGELGEA